MDNKEKLNKPENNEEFIIPEFEDYQSKKKPDVDEVIKKLNERITALEAEENTLEEIKEILEKHNLKYLCDPDLNAVEIMFDERPFRVQIILNEYRLELKLIFPFAAQRASLAMIALFMINFNKDKAFACMHLNPDNGEMSMKYSYFISKTAGLGSLIIIGKEVNDPDIYCILIPILTICWIIAMVVCDVSEEENPIYLFVVAAIQYFAVEYLGIGVFAILLMLMQTISVFTRQNKNADEILLMVFTFIGALYLKVKDFHYIEVTDNNILIGTSTIGLMSRHTWSIIIYILLALSIVLLSILSYITFRKNEKYIRAQIVFTAGIGFILMVLYDIFINTRGYIFDYTTDNVMIRNGVISCMLARGMMMLFAFIVLRIQYNSEPELSEIVIYDEIDLATQIYDEKAELLKKEYTNRIRLYRKSVENILKEKEKTEEEKE